MTTRSQWILAALQGTLDRLTLPRLLQLLGQCLQQRHRVAAAAEHRIARRQFFAQIGGCSLRGIGIERQRVGLRIRQQRLGHFCAQRQTPFVGAHLPRRPLRHRFAPLLGGPEQQRQRTHPRCMAQAAGRLLQRQ